MKADMAAAMVANGQPRVQKLTTHKHGTTTNRIGNQFIGCFNIVHPRVDGKTAGLPRQVLAKTGAWQKIYWFRAAALGGKSSVG
jgi:hypothetical protein